jgi:uncharacterized protein involved in cysteine biosynthesis
MLTAFSLTLAQLGDRPIRAVLFKSAAITLLAMLVLGSAGWWGLDHLLAAGGLGDRLLPYGGALRQVLAAVLALTLGWLLFRLVAMAVIQFFADEAVIAVETRHYPAAAQAAQPLGWRAELALGLRGLLRALGYNVVALPAALLLLVTGVGPAVLFALVNAVLLGRELDDMVRLRHRDASGAPLQKTPAMTRFGLGLIVVVLLAIPVAGFLAPLIGAMMATHLVHRRAGGYGARP